MLIQQIEKIDTAEILKAYYQLESKIVWVDYGFKGKQTGLQYIGDEDPWTSAAGRLKEEYKTSQRELEFNQLNPFFKNTIFEDIINKYKLIRTRFVWLNPHACYSMHCDTSPRIHIPLVTNPNCYFIFKHDKPVFLEPGYVHLVDTRLMHSTMNCSNSPRLHILAAISP